MNNCRSYAFFLDLLGWVDRVSHWVTWSVGSVRWNANATTKTNPTITTNKTNGKWKVYGCIEMLTRRINLVCCAKPFFRNLCCFVLPKNEPHSCWRATKPRWEGKKRRQTLWLYEHFSLRDVFISSLENIFFVFFFVPLQPTQAKKKYRH